MRRLALLALALPLLAGCYTAGRPYPDPEASYRVRLPGDPPEPVPQRAASPWLEVDRSPCDDSLYVALRGRPLGDLTEREYAYRMQYEQACTEYQRTRPAVRAVEHSAETQRTALGWLVGLGLASVVLTLALL